MSAAAKTFLTPEQYLSIDRRAAVRSEYYGGEMFAMAGASLAHNLIKENLVGELYARLKGGSYRAISSDMRVKLEAAKAYVYPDIFVLGESPLFADEKRDILLNPRVVIEILSPASERFDRGGKFRHYLKIPSLREYVRVCQDETVCERLMADAEGKWQYRAFAGPNTVLQFASVPVRVPLKDIYAGVQFVEETAEVEPG